MELAYVMSVLSGPRGLGFCVSPLTGTQFVCPMYPATLDGITSDDLVGYVINKGVYTSFSHDVF